MAKLSKKQAQQIANLINTTTVWCIATKDEVAKKDDMDTTKVRYYMERHDEAAKELNRLLGVPAVVLYSQETA